MGGRAEGQACTDPGARTPATLNKITPKLLGTDCFIYSSHPLLNRVNRSIGQEEENMVDGRTDIDNPLSSIMFTKGQEDKTRYDTFHRKCQRDNALLK